MFRYAIAVLTFTASPAMAAQCFPSEMVEGVLAGEGMVPALAGPDANGDRVVIFLGKDAGWTLVVYPKSKLGIACPIGSGPALLPVEAGVPS